MKSSIASALALVLCATTAHAQSEEPEPSPNPVEEQEVDASQDELPPEGSGEQVDAAHATVPIPGTEDKDEGWDVTAPRKAEAHREIVHAAVKDKNWFWINDFKIPNGVHVFGRRYKPFGPGNYPFEIVGVAPEDFKGLNRRNGWYAAIMAMVMFSMAGIPIFVGFFAKLLVIKAVLDAGMVSLAVAAVVLSGSVRARSVSTRDIAPRP